MPNRGQNKARGRPAKYSRPSSVYKDTPSKKRKLGDTNFGTPVRPALQKRLKCNTGDIQRNIIQQSASERLKEKFGIDCLDLPDVRESEF